MSDLRLNAIGCRMPNLSVVNLVNFLFCRIKSRFTSYPASLITCTIFSGFIFVDSNRPSLLQLTSISTETPSVNLDLSIKSVFAKPSPIPKAH